MDTRKGICRFAFYHLSYILEILDMFLIIRHNYLGPVKQNSYS